MKAPPDTDYSHLSGAYQEGGDIPLDRVLPTLSVVDLYALLLAINERIVRQYLFVEALL